MSTAHTPIHRRHLKRTLTAVAVLVLAAILIALLVDRIFYNSGSPAGTGSGIAATQARSVPSFTGVDLAGDNNVVVQVGARQSVIVHAETNLIRRVTTHVQSGTLVIGTTPGNLSAKTPMFVAVTLASLNVLMLQGDGTITVTGIKSRNLTVTIPGSGTINATGTATRLDVTVGGSGTALLGPLIARNVKAALSGEGSITLTATHSLTASVSGSGTILYNGNPPNVTKTVTGSGIITGE